MDNNQENIQEEYDEADRIISKQQEQAYRLVAGEFEGRSVGDAAKIMGISRTTLWRILKNLKKEAPQLFPIITKDEYDTLIRLQAGMSVSRIAEISKMSISTIEKRIESLVRKGRWVARISKTVRYSPNLDEKVVRKF